jgi:hypothetical protein
MKIGAAIFFTDYSMAPTELAVALEERSLGEADPADRKPTLTPMSSISAGPVALAKGVAR